MFCCINIYFNNNLVSNSKLINAIFSTKISILTSASSNPTLCVIFFRVFCKLYTIPKGKHIRSEKQRSIKAKCCLKLPTHFSSDSWCYSTYIDDRTRCRFLKFYNNCNMDLLFGFNLLWRGPFQSSTIIIFGALFFRVSVVDVLIHAAESARLWWRNKRWSCGVKFGSPLIFALTMFLPLVPWGKCLYACLFCF